MGPDVTSLQHRRAEHRWERVRGGLLPGRQGQRAGIPSFCRDRLAGVETPKRVVLAAGLPEAVGGKVLKYKPRGTCRDLCR
jgi:hypothetical protein